MFVIQHTQLVIFKPLNYYFEETKGYDVKASFISRPVSHLIMWYNKPRDITKEFSELAIQFHWTFHGLKITNCTSIWPNFILIVLRIKDVKELSSLISLLGFTKNKHKYNIHYAAMSMMTSQILNCKILLQKNSFAAEVTFKWPRV